MAGVGNQRTIPAQAIRGVMTTPLGVPVLSTETASDDPDEVGFGPAMRRYILTGLYNSDFAAPPPNPNGPVSDDNPLPNWDWVPVSGTSISATAFPDPLSASGYVLRFAMIAGAASDDACVEQISPVAGSRGRSFGSWPFLTFVTGPTVSNAQVYVSGQYLRRDKTATGSSVELAAATTTYGANHTDEITTGPIAGGNVPSDAYWLRTRVGFRRSTAGTSTTEYVDFCEARIEVGRSFFYVIDRNATGTAYGQLWNLDGDTILQTQGTGTGDINLVSNGGIALRPTSPGALVLAGRLVLDPVDWTPSAASDQIPILSPLYFVAPASNLTLTSTPTAPNGTNGQVLRIVNTSSNTLTLQDQGTLASSNLRLTTATVTLGARDSIALAFSSAIGDWVEIARSNVI